MASPRSWAEPAYATIGAAFDARDSAFRDTGGVTFGRPPDLGDEAVQLTTNLSVSSNGIAVPFDSEHFAPLRDSSHLTGDPEAMRMRYESDGYLFLRSFLDSASVRKIRGAYFSRFEASYLAEGTSPDEGVFSGSRPTELPAHGLPGHPAHAFVRSAEFEAFASQPAIQELAESLLGGPVSRLPRSIVRHFDKSSPRASRAHVDHTYLDRGTDRLVTMWIPIGDCPLQTGGLVYLEGSHQMSDEQFAPLRSVTDRPSDTRPISHDLGWVAEALGRRWLWADYGAGDVTVHSPHMVHASLDTTTEVMRLSADVRFLKEGDSPDPRWLVPWAGDDGN